MFKKSDTITNNIVLNLDKRIQKLDNHLLRQTHCIVTGGFGSGKVYRCNEKIYVKTCDVRL